MNSMTMTFWLELGNVKKLEHYILGLSFEMLNMIYEDYCMENVMRNLKWNPEKYKWHEYGKWQEMGIHGIVHMTWVRMDFS